MLLFLVLAAGGIGLLIGSFLNVVIWRVPRGESVVSPPSACPGCGSAIRPRDNVPVLSWLLLRGRCRDCSAPISGRYPAVELLTGALFAGTAARIGIEPALPAFLVLVAFGVALALIDFDTQRLPDALTLPLVGVEVGLLLVAAVADDDLAHWGRALAGGALLGGFYFATWFLYPGGMGFGDVKLAPSLGLVLGWLGYGVLAVGAFLGFLLGAVVGVAAMSVGSAGRKTRLPFGPFMIAGTLLAVFAGQEIVDLYRQVALG